MNSLSIYVEKWYIVGAVCTDNVPHPIELPNHDDRIWLYFYNDIANDAVYYGRANKKNAQNKENHYIDDVFAEIVDSNASFKKFGRNYPISEIFKYSGIFDDLKAAFGKWSHDTIIPLYVSFSQDISYGAQNIFKAELDKNDFVIKQFVGKIDFLALEWVRKKKNLKLPRDKHALVLRSTNENLHMSLFKTDGSIFLEEAKDCLKGYGSDVRRHAVIEDVIHQGNATFHFLTKDEDFIHEKNRMEEFVEDWILKLDHGRAGIPVRIPNISFSLAPNNKFTANLRRSSIDERTKAIIRVIIDYVKDFVKNKNGLGEYDLGAVVLLGNSFGNTQYLNELDNWLQISGEKMYSINEATLPDVVGVYSQIDPGYFSTAENIFAEQAGMERERQLQAEQEEKDRKLAAEAADKKRQTEAEKSQIEKKYKDAMEQAYGAESKRDYASMREFLSIALDAKPLDDTASKKLQQLNDMEMRESLKSDQYRAAINQADHAFDVGDLDLAYSFYTQALTIDSNSNHAKTRLEDVRKQKSDKNRSAEFLTKAEVFEGQKLYDKALTELKKAQLLNPLDNEIASKVAEIEETIKKRDDEIRSLKILLESSEEREDYFQAIEACERLMSLDSLNSSKWELKRDDLQSQKAQRDEKEAVLSECREKVNAAVFNENWEDVLQYSTKALTYSPKDEFFSGRLERAKKEIEKKKRGINSKTYRPVKDFTTTPKPKPKVNSPGGSVDPFFSSDAAKNTQKPVVNGDLFFAEGNKRSANKKNDDFFDTPSTKVQKVSNNQKNPKDDFDF